MDDDHQECLCTLSGEDNASILQRALAVCKEKIRYEKGDQEGKYPLPPLPRLLPPLIKLLVSKTPILYRPAVAQAVFPALAAHLWNTTLPLHR